MKSFADLNGEFLNASEPILRINNRAFQYGDGLFETILFQDKKFLFLDDHIERLLRGMKLLKMEIPKKFSPAYFRKEIKKLLVKNSIKTNARIRLQVFRNEGGYHSPSNNSPSFLIAAEKIEETRYALNKKGLVIDVFTELKKNNLPLSNFKTLNSIQYVLAGLYAKENSLDDCFILNTENKITDAISSNVFIVSKNIISTPALSDGCVDGVMRKNILKFLREEKTPFYERSIDETDILNADEIFITNVINGIRWIEKFKEREYKNSFSKMLFEKFLLFIR